LWLHYTYLDKPELSLHLNMLYLIIFTTFLGCVR
jgi:hypothetical protein